MGPKWIGNGSGNGQNPTKLTVSEPFHDLILSVLPGLGVVVSESAKHNIHQQQTQKYWPNGANRSRAQASPSSSHHPLHSLLVFEATNPQTDVREKQIGRWENQSGEHFSEEGYPWRRLDFAGLEKFNLAWRNPSRSDRDS